MSIDGVRGVQAHAEGVVQIHQGLGCVLADKGDAFFAFRLGLDNKCVVGLLQEVLEVGQVLQVSHCCIPHSGYTLFCFRPFHADCYVIILTQYVPYVNPVMIFHHFAVEMSRIVVQNIQYFGVASNIRVENSPSGPSGGREPYAASGQQKAPGGNASRSLPRGFDPKWYAQNATFMNSATPHRITASGIRRHSGRRRTRTRRGGGGCRC